MEDYKCTTVVSFEYKHNGKWERKRLGIQSYNSELSNEDLLILICDYYPSAKKENILFINRWNEEVKLSEVDRFFESVLCRALSDKDFYTGETIVVNQELFAEYLKDTVERFGV